MGVSPSTARFSVRVSAAAKASALRRLEGALKLVVVARMRRAHQELRFASGHYRLPATN
jgi:hypothetical protein